MTKTSTKPGQEPVPKFILPDRGPQAQKLTDAAWDFAYAALWPKEKFRESAIKAFKNTIVYYLQDDSFLRQSFRIFLEAVALFKKNYAQEKLTQPLVWLNQGYRAGFTQALQCYQRARELRKNIPLYEQEVHALAVTISKYIKRPTRSMLHSRRSTLLLQRDENLLQLFCGFIIHYQHIH
jgi:hypothetical protein